MTCEELREQYELYALGLLEAPERDELEDHLRREGDPCVAGVHRARQLVSSLAATVSDVDPPARLRKRVLSLAGEEVGSRSWVPLWIAVSACLAIATVWLGVDRRDRGLTIASIRSEMQRKTTELAHLNEALALMNDPGVKEVVFGAGTPAPPRGRVFVHPQNGVLLIASNLPPAPSGKIYEMWIIPKAGNPLPAGLFQSDAAGSVLYLRQGAVDMASAGAIAVTLEREGGVAAPTSTPLIVAAL